MHAIANYPGKRFWKGTGFVTEQLCDLPAEWPRQASTMCLCFCVSHLERGCARAREIQDVTHFYAQAPITFQS